MKYHTTLFGGVHTSTYKRYFNPDDNLIISRTAFAIDSPLTACVHEHLFIIEKCDVNIHVCLHYIYTAYCYVHIHIASTINEFGIWDNF